MDPDHFDHRRLVPLEVKAGAVVWFGAFLVHRSLPNRSDADRRALLYSYQPAGYPHALEIARQMEEEAKRTGKREFL
jgi:ectoine hydroxylase-related dioxygenase (phytanoyl-CoA dioxygenase family)